MYVLVFLQAQLPQGVHRSLADGQENMSIMQARHCGGLEGESECMVEL